MKWLWTHWKIFFLRSNVKKTYTASCLVLLLSYPHKHTHTHAAPIVPSRGELVLSKQHLTLSVVFCTISSRYLDRVGSKYSALLHWIHSASALKFSLPYLRRVHLRRARKKAINNVLFQDKAHILITLSLEQWNAVLPDARRWQKCDNIRGLIKMNQFSSFSVPGSANIIKCIVVFTVCVLNQFRGWQVGIWVKEKERERDRARNVRVVLNVNKKI